MGRGYPASAAQRAGHTYMVAVAGGRWPLGGCHVGGAGVRRLRGGYVGLVGLVGPGGDAATPARHPAAVVYNYVAMLI